MTGIVNFFLTIKAQVSSNKEMFENQPMLKGHYEVLIDIIVEGFQEMIRIVKLRPQKTDFEVKTQGHLVLMTCGHRGRPSRQEEKRISRLLRKSSFIPMLEEIYGVQNGVADDNTKNFNERKSTKKGLQQKKPQAEPQEVIGPKFGADAIP